MEASQKDILAGGEKIAMHRHGAPYAAIVVAGAYREHSIDGAFLCRPGHVVFHPAMHAHANEAQDVGAEIVNVALPAAALGFDGYRIAFLAEIERALAANDRASALIALLQAAAPDPAPLVNTDWTSRLAFRLKNGGGALGDLVEVKLSRSHVSRAFHARRGMTTRAFRRECRLRRAMLLLSEGARPLEAAMGAGYADQAHLTRELKRETGMTPARFRAGLD